MPQYFKSVFAGSMMSLITAFSTQAEEKRSPPFIDMHAVIAIDVSGSVQYGEQSAMMKGYAMALTSPEAKADFDNQSYALSLVYFGTKARHMVTEVIHNSDDALKFAQKYLWNFDTNAPQSIPYDLGRDTSTAASLDISADLFSHESDYGFQSINKSVIVSGDDNGPDRFARNSTIRLGQEYNATVYGIPIMVEETHNINMLENYKLDITTPQGLVFISKEGRKAPVKKGISIPAMAAEDITPVVNDALRLGMF